jgi:heat-inducible transcriptional repressor
LQELKFFMTPRQQQILQSIVEYYVQTAFPVGSLGLSQKFNYSPATIRAEMASLELSGYIMHPHTSAGRIPTDKGYRYYVDSLKDKQEENERVRIYKAIDHRIAAAGEPRQAIKSAIDTLVEVTNNLALATIGSSIHMNGLSHLFAQPEFTSIAKVHQVAKLLDELEPWLQEISPQSKVEVYIGGENPIGRASGCSLVISRFNSPLSNRNYIGIIGPTRQSYPQVMRLVEQVSKSLEEAMA